MSLLRLFVKFNHKIKFKLFLIKFKSKTLWFVFEIMMTFFSNNIRCMQVFNSYMAIKCLNEYFKFFNYLLEKFNDHYDVIKFSLIFMSCLKTVWNGQNGSNSNRYISGTNWIFACGFLHYDH